ncbi:MAG: hypothetical protein K2O34_04025 [Acetatifactor sp.]|nr:hypothetical protein [Acetatifactor sp.]
MDLRKKLTLWQKLRIKYEYGWMDHDFHFHKVIARPTWFMTHNIKQIERRIASYKVMMEKSLKKEAERQLRIKKMQRQLFEEEQSQNRRGA